MSSASSVPGRDIIVIGASAGGVPALQRLVATLPADLPAAVFVVLHLWPEAESSLPSILDRAGAWEVSHAEHGAPIERGKIRVAPADLHLLLEPDRVLLSRSPRENRFRPAIDPLFRSAAIAFRERVTGVILTGMLDDGAAGLWMIKQCGGAAVVQSDAEYDEMPRSALVSGEVDYHVPLAEIPGVLARLASEEAAALPSDGLPEVARIHYEELPPL